MDTAERRRASRLDAAGMPGSARAPYRASGARRNLRLLWRRGPKTLKIFFACGELISILSLSQLFHTTLSVTRSDAILGKAPPRLVARMSQLLWGLLVPVRCACCVMHALRRARAGRGACVCASPARWGPSTPTHLDCFISPAAYSNPPPPVPRSKPRRSE